MNIWTAFFLVVSIVILAAPILLSRETPDGNGPDRTDISDKGPVLEDDELELDLVSGRLSSEDYEIMAGRKSGSASV